MRVVRRADEMTRLATISHRRGRTIGLVPTMGALHDGHLSLIRAAHHQTDVVVVSIFVNPLQFGPREDYRHYPRPLARDLALARRAGCDVAFVPSVRELYPQEFSTSVEVEGLSRRWEGAIRPGHFRGVATIVAKLLNLVQPTVAYVGQKDYQQALVIQRLVRDLEMPIRIRVLPIVREPNGLAMSSRNASLTSRQRRQVPVLYEALCLARRHIRAGERSASRLRALMRNLIRHESSVRIDYLAVVDARTLEPVSHAAGRLAILGAIRMGSTRLIDNVLVDVP